MDSWPMFESGLFPGNRQSVRGPLFPLTDRVCMITASDTAERIWDNPEMIPHGPSTSEISQLTNLVGTLSSNQMGERDGAV